MSRFRWTTFDLNSTLPGWQQEIRMAAVDADFREFPRTPILSREAATVRHISRGRVHADQVRRRLPWLYESYRGEFLELAAETARSPSWRHATTVTASCSMCSEAQRCGSSATSTPTR